MKIVITGLPQAGQQELFSIISGQDIEQIRQKPMEAQTGASDVKDPRVTKLVEIFNPKKTTYAKIEYSLLPDVAFQGALLKNADEICYVSLSDNAAGNIQSFVSELIIADMMLVDKRLETLVKEQKKKNGEAQKKEQDLMAKCKEWLEKENPLSKMELAEEQAKTVRTYQFLTFKPLVLVINMPENKINDQSLVREIKTKYSYPCIQLSAGIEAEINQLSAKDRADFMKEVGIDEPAIDKMNRVVFEGLGLISFFTVGEDEVRAWPIKKGAAAEEAGGVIHSDIKKGFVRVEMMKYNDFIALGSEAKVKEAGKFSLKGRDYLVEDGDLLSFRFNV
ncbi:hypothetical protein A3F86_03240 [candidate division WOR-1 bacterium RIFCSPLOWO2_12_FULL_45_9]|uniref:YchF C-terminal domain-containing protein n=1 Tax=candidate division WOR-1 bacterium RIFCSPLOWO2_12_FULL_45_9 TaxID=1802568 RepID=A0A1F4RI93_UNCSA|nr:MAG: hypothetical protein A3F86_03240 [candidate division WOR-1 bacterium RIFCSPLOWO2_12_FULL_45_9]